MAALILASTSVYRRQLLARLRLPFEAVAPQVDETALPGESAAELAGRLAAAKAAAVAATFPGAWVIGSDQVAELDGQILGKPGSSDNAIAQLRAMRGRDVLFHTAVHLCREGSGDGRQDLTRVRLRDLDDAAIVRYVDAERPLDCAGSFKVEGLGIVLFDAVQSRDPTALIGLPLIATTELLRNAGHSLP